LGSSYLKPRGASAPRIRRKIIDTSVHDELTGDEYLVARLGQIEDGSWLILIVDFDTNKIHTSGVEYTQHAAEEWAKRCLTNIAKGLEEPPDAFERSN
tara:strand:- start:170 stop:463 length:294 start_codon:yes stop_codon:yes gene_type:complete